MTQAFSFIFKRWIHGKRNMLPWPNHLGVEFWMTYVFVLTVVWNLFVWFQLQNSTRLWVLIVRHARTFLDRSSMVFIVRQIHILNACTSVCMWIMCKHLSIYSIDNQMPGVLEIELTKNIGIVGLFPSCKIRCPSIIKKWIALDNLFQQYQVSSTNISKILCSEWQIY